MNQELRVETDDTRVERLEAQLNGVMNSFAKAQQRLDDLEVLEICEFCDVRIPDDTFNVCGCCYNKTVNNLHAQLTIARHEALKDVEKVVGNLVSRDHVFGHACYFTEDVSAALSILE